MAQWEESSATNAGGTGGAASVPGWRGTPGVGSSNPLHYSCLGNPVDRGAWWATVHGATKSRTSLSSVGKHL